MTRVVLITGPSGAGKTATATAFASSRESTTAIVDQDLLRTFIKSGFARPDTDWGPEAERQWALSRQIGIDMVCRYLGAGIDCVIETYAPGPDPAKWQAGLPVGTPFDTVVLRPTLAVAAERNGLRTDHEPTDADALERNYDAFRGDDPVAGATRIDNSSLSIAEVVSLIAETLRWK
jgi:AAA domain-containing protein